MNTKELLQQLISEFKDSILLQDIDLEYIANNLTDETIDDIKEQKDTLLQEGSDIIYYSNAMQFLMENDITLQNSCRMAYDMGYELKNLNSEVLASLWNYDLMNTEFNEIWNKLIN
jgi:hypothetical protein